jgi:AraC-like DNA-binding protein
MTRRYDPGIPPLLDKRDSSEVPMPVPRGRPDAVLRPSDAERALTIARLAPAPSLRAFVDYHWYVGWDVDRPHAQQVVPQPRVHVVAEEGRLLVHGVSREPFVRVLTGAGHTWGAAFVPGGFRPLLRDRVGTLCDRVLPAADLFGVDDRPAAQSILATTDRTVMAGVLESYLLALAPEPDPRVERVRDLVERAETDRAVTRVEHLAVHASTSVRSLQRLFTEYVGVGPKWVIARCRILDAAAAAHSGVPVDWATLAVELGFTDQAHLTRAFTSVVGTPPATYARHA